MNNIGLFWMMMIFFFFSSCGDSKDGKRNRGASSGTGNISAVLTSSELQAKNSLRGLRKSAVNCSLQPVNGPDHQGLCFTPISFRAKASTIELGGSIGGGRLINLSADVSGAGLQGTYGVLGLADFNFAEKNRANNPYSDDNLQDIPGEPIYSELIVHVGSIELELELPVSNSNLSERFWVIRYMLMPQNPLQISSFNDCGLDQGTQQVIADEGNLYSVPSLFEQGDILVCLKNTADGVCNDSDFRWVDAQTGSLSSTRPSNPVKLSGSNLLSAPSCVASNPYPEMNWGHGLVRAGLPLGSQFRLVKGANYTQAEDSAGQFINYFTYTFTGSCNIQTSSCSDAPIDVQKFTVELDFDLTNSIFVHETVDLENDTPADILKNMNKILPKSMYIDEYRTDNFTDFRDASISASVTIIPETIN